MSMLKCCLEKVDEIICATFKCYSLMLHNGVLFSVTPQTVQLHVWTQLYLTSTNCTLLQSLKNPSVYLLAR